jgi:hypothetical protein
VIIVRATGLLREVVVRGGVEPPTFRFQKACHGRAPSALVDPVSPLHLHKGLSRAYEDILALVPPCAAKCASSVGISWGDGAERGLVEFLWGARAQVRRARRP